MLWIKPCYRLREAVTQRFPSGGYLLACDIAFAHGRASPWNGWMPQGTGIGQQQAEKSLHQPQSMPESRHFARFMVYRSGRPWFVAFSRDFATRVCKAIRDRGESADYAEYNGAGTERPAKRSYEHSARVVLPSVKPSPQRALSAPSERVHYWGQGARPIVQETAYLVEEFDLRHQAWVTLKRYEYRYQAERACLRGQRVRAISTRPECGYSTVRG